MEACRKRVGLEEVATPSGVILDDPTTRGQAMTPEMAGQLRLKVQHCPQRRVGSCSTSACDAI